MLALAAVAVALTPSFGAAQANGTHGPRAAEEPPTRFELFLLSGCMPCVTESHLVATIPIGSLKVAFPGSAGAQATRSGEISFEAVRAHRLGRPSRQSLALRLTLSVSGGGVGGQLYRMAVGLVDEEDVPALSAAISDIAQVAATAPPNPGAEHTDISAQAGSLRIGLLRLRSESVAYAQAGALSMMTLRPVWEVPTTMYLTPDQLPALASAIGQAAAKIRQLRGS